jgi:hypothetical protein
VRRKIMLTRRTFIQSAGALAVGATAGGIAFTKPEIKEHGIVEIRFRFFTNEPIVVKSTIFSDEQRGVFGIRFLGERGPLDVRLTELRLADVKGALAAAGRIRKCGITTWNGEGKREKVLLELMTKGGNLLLAAPGQLDDPAWMDLADVRQVL